MKEIEFEVLGRRLTALRSGEPGQPRLLALHGWLDNAASFEPLAQLLPDVEIVALDMAGHGQSAHRSADGEYNIWSDLPDIQGVADQLGWDSFFLAGHSRGAVVASLFASALPERVQHLFLLDGLPAQPADPLECNQQLAKFLHDKARLLDRQSRVFTSQQDAIAVRIAKGLLPEAASLIATRNLRPVESGWCWSTDARLQGASALKLTAAHIDSVLTGLSMPVLLLLAEQGLDKEMAYTSSTATMPATIEVEHVRGGHHCHMDESVEEVAAFLRGRIFLERSA